MSNQVDIDKDIITETNTKIVTQNTLKQAYTTSAQLGLLQVANIDLSNNSGDIVIGDIEQNQDAKLSFTSIKPDTVFNEASIEIIESTVKEFEKLGNEKLETILSNAEAKDNSKFIVPLNPILEMNTRYASVDTILTPTNYNKLRNVVANNLTNNFTRNIVMSCIANISAKQTLDLSIKNEGLVQIGTIVQNQAAQLLMSCTQLTSSMNKTTTDIMNTLGLEQIEKTTVLQPTSIQRTVQKTAQPIPTKNDNTLIMNNKQSILGLMSIISCCMCCVCVLLILFFIITTI